MPPHPEPSQTIALSRETAEYLLEFIDFITPPAMKNDPQLLPAVQELENAAGIHFLNPEPADLTDEQAATILRIHEEVNRETDLADAQAGRKAESRILKEVLDRNPA